MLLSGDSAEAAAAIIEKEGEAVLKVDVADAIAKNYKDLKAPRDVMVKSWQDDPTAGGAWVSQHNRGQRMLAAKPLGDVSFSGDYLGFDCKKGESGKSVCADFSGSVHGAVIAGRNQAKLTHDRHIGKEVEGKQSGAWPLPGADASEMWQDSYARSFHEKEAEMGPSLGESVASIAMLLCISRGLCRTSILGKCRGSHVRNAPRYVRQEIAKEEVSEMGLTPFNRRTKVKKAKFDKKVAAAQRGAKKDKHKTKPNARNSKGGGRKSNHR